MFAACRMFANALSYFIQADDAVQPAGVGRYVDGVLADDGNGAATLRAVVAQSSVVARSQAVVAYSRAAAAPCQPTAAVP